MPRLTLDDGRWLDLRLPTTDEFLALLDAEDADPERPETLVSRLRAVRAALNDACSGTSWDGRPSDLPPAGLVALAARWMQATEDDALPPASGTGSGTT